MVGVCGEPGLKNPEVGFRDLNNLFFSKKKKDSDLIVEIISFVINILN